MLCPYSDTSDSDSENGGKTQCLKKNYILFVNLSKIMLIASCRKSFEWYFVDRWLDITVKGGQRKKISRIVE